MALPSQIPQMNWNPNPGGYTPNQGENAMYGTGNGMADAIMGNQLGSYLGFGNQMQGVMDRMLMMNLMNQRASQNNSALNAQMGQTQMNSNALIQAALAGALGNIGMANQNRQASMYNTDNAGVSLANVQNQGAKDRLSALPGILSSVAGMFNFGGGSGGQGGGLLGFQNGATGQSATMPGAGTATSMAVQAGRPLPQQAEQSAIGAPSVNPALAGMAQGRKPQSFQNGRDYLMQFLGAV